MQSLLDETWTALERQTAALTRKTESLRQLARTGMAAMAGALAGAGLLLQAGAVFSPSALILLATGLVGVLLAIAWAVASSSLAEGIDLAIGPDPDVLRRLEGLDEMALKASRLELALRILQYNRIGLVRAARSVRGALFLLMASTLLLASAFAFVLGGSIP